MNLNRARQPAHALDARELRWMHDCLTIYNGMVVTLAAAFMSITQLKVIQTYNARAFLEQLAAIPLPPLTGFLLTVTSFLILAGLGWLYREGNVPPTMRYICLSLEIVACVVIIRSLNLAYDGVVLLVVADLLHRYSGRHQLILLTVAMLGLYAIVDYNIVSLEYHIAPLTPMPLTMPQDRAPGSSRCTMLSSR